MLCCVRQTMACSLCSVTRRIYYDEDAVIVERDMMVGKHCFHVTSVFPSQPTATATKKLLAYIDASVEKENR